MIGRQTPGALSGQVIITAPARGELARKHTRHYHDFNISMLPVLFRLSLGMPDARQNQPYSCRGDSADGGLGTSFDDRAIGKPSSPNRMPVPFTSSRSQRLATGNRTATRRMLMMRWRSQIPLAAHRRVGYQLAGICSAQNSRPS